MKIESLVDELLLYTDGASRGNPGEAAIGYSVKTPGDSVVAEHAERIGRATNNQAEYRAHIAGLHACERYTRGKVCAYSDSEVMIRQLRGEYKVKDPELKFLWEQARTLGRRFKEITYMHRRRSDPFIARVDRLVNQALDAGAV